jgi:hypothetical protein
MVVDFPNFRYTSIVSVCEMNLNHGVFIGGNLNFLGSFGAISIKTASFFSLNGQIHIQTINFEFKRTNQEATPHYSPPTSSTGGSARPGPNAAGTTRSDQAASPTPTRLASSARAGDSATGADATTPVGTSLMRRNFVDSKSAPPNIREVFGYRDVFING